MSWSDFFDEALNKKEAVNGLRVQGGVLGNRTGPWIDFGSNDYLGLREHPAVLNALSRGTALGSGASPVLTGHSDCHQEVERLLSALSGSCRSMVFSSGFACNTGVIAALAQAEDLVLSDQLNHASLIDGTRLAKARVHIYPHISVEAAESYLRDHRHEFRNALLITESVFSMDGDLAPLSELSEVCERHDCGLVVDEAHATGVYGRNGGGLTEEFDIQQNVLCKLGTLSKALGGVGGFVSGSEACVRYLINYCRSYIFSTAPSPAVMQGVRAALELLPGLGQSRQELRAMSKQLRNDLQVQGWKCGNTSDPRQAADSPIIPIIVGSAERALRLSRLLLEKKIYVPAIRPPTVPEGSCRLRISLSTKHNQEDIDRLIETFGTLSET